MTLAGDLNRLSNRFAVGNPWRKHFDVQVEISQQSILDNLQVQFAHSGNQSLSRLFFDRGLESRILPLEHLKHLFQFLPVGSRLRLDRHLDYRFGKLDRF